MNLLALSPMIPTGAELSALLVVVSFSAGPERLRHSGDAGIVGAIQLLVLPTALHVVQDWKIIAACGVLFLLEFVGDKIPVFDLLWNAAHTFVRVPVAAYLAFRGNFAAAPVGTTRRDVCGWVDRARGTRRQNRGARGGDQFARAGDEFRTESGRRRAGGVSNVFCDQTSIRRVGDGIRGAGRDRVADALRGARLAVALQRRGKRAHARARKFRFVKSSK